MNKKLKIGLLSGAISLLSALTITANTLAFGIFHGTLETFFGVNGASTNNFETAQYFARKEESALKATEKANKLAKDIVGEGCVLLKNNNVLPLKTGNQVSLFSQSSVDIIYGSVGGSGDIDTGNLKTLKETLEEVNFNVNPVLWKFYKDKNYHRKTGGLAGGLADNTKKEWQINEIPQSEYTDAVRQSYKAYNDAAIVVISRTGCENGDLTRDMSSWTNGENTGSILELDQNEKDMLQNVCNNFDKVVVLLNTSNPMEEGFLDEFGGKIGACLWIGGVGQYGLEAVSDILVGNVNPSGRLVDTHAYDLFSAPAMQNMGDFAYNAKHNYVAYAEGIYVGYKYYETRYADYIMNTSNVGDFNYDKVVQFPFGYGLSYTTFKWTDFSCKVVNDEVKGSITVTNNGLSKGKDVVEIYYQSPYTPYDRSNGIEKSAVELVTFVKTDLLEPNQSQKIDFSFPLEDMKSYDKSGEKNNGKGCYLLEASKKYYVTAGRNAHDAINNILFSESYNVDGDKSLATTLNIKETIYDKDNKSGTSIDNIFTDADGNTTYDQRIKYLSRSKWNVLERSKDSYNRNSGIRYGSEIIEEKNRSTASSTGDGTRYRHSIGSTLLNETLNAATKRSYGEQAYLASGTEEKSEDFTSPLYNVDTNLKLISLKGKDFNDPEWDKLLNQLKIKEATSIVKNSGFKTSAIPSVGKPYATDSDGPQAWNSYIGNGVSAGGFPYEIVIASTWNTSLAYEMGNIMGELCLWSKITAKDTAANLTGWYAPAMNIHRTPFGGRNFEYYSEDSTLSAKIGASTVKGATEKGVITYIKHFALNEQEANRMTDNVVWIEEQALREIYLKPFEESIKEGGSLGVMTSYNRIGATWAGGSYALITKLLRNEWGFNGVVITDYMDGDYENVDQMLAAGGDMALLPVDNQKCKTDSAQALTYIRRALHHLLYAFSNSNGMNGIEGYTEVSGGTPNFYYIMIGVNALLFIQIVVCGVLLITTFTNKKEGEKVNEKENNI